MHLGRVSKLEGRMYHERQGRRVARARARGSCVMISMLAHGARVLHEERVAVGHVIQREQTDAHFAIHSNVRAARSARDGACGLSFEALSYHVVEHGLVVEPRLGPHRLHAPRPLARESERRLR